MFIMNKEIKFLIPFSGLKEGKHSFDFQVDNRLFDSYNYVDFNSVDAKVEVLLNKKSTLLELSFTFKGSVNVPCDVTNQDFDLFLKGDLGLIVKYGDSFNNDHDEILIIPFNEHQLDVAQYIYEMIALSIPQKRIHPGVLDGTLESEALTFLGYQDEEDLEYEDDMEEEHEVEENNEIDIDPRWEKLKKLLTDK